MTIRSSLRDTLWAIAGHSGIASLAGQLLHSPKSLRILMYHDVPSEVLPAFKSQLKWLTQRFEIITPKDFVTGNSRGERPKVLLTFDDGCEDNYEVVAPLLESQGLRGLFFVCPGFSGLSREASFELMERSSALLGETNRDSRWQRMSQQQIVNLDKRGHGIGNHTMTHVPLARSDPQEMDREISNSASTLQSWLGHPCLFFAWTYYWNEISSASLKIAQTYHRYCFSPCSGLNSWPISRRLLWRTGVDVRKPLSSFKSQISGVVDCMYSAQRQKLLSMWDRSTVSTDLNVPEGPTLKL
jgi:peptidoglycan/xylan/chitin deacetylase (PgdA/CDA1 family)